MAAAASRVVFLLNGPNLNLLGAREPEIYGRRTLADIVAEAEARARALNLTLRARQSNHEGALIDCVHAARAEGAAAIIVNAGAYTHTSIALRDALAACAGMVIVEVHLSLPARREAFRHISHIAPVADGVISGFGADGYMLALEAVARRLDAQEITP